MILPALILPAKLHPNQLTRLTTVPETDRHTHSGQTYNTPRFVWGVSKIVGRILL